VSAWLSLHWFAAVVWLVVFALVLVVGWWWQRRQR